MRKIVVVLICTLYIPALIAQIADSSFLMKEDYILKKIIPSLPQGWTFTATNGTLTLQRTDSIFEVEKKIFHVKSYLAVAADTIVKFGKKSVSQIIYHYEPRWTFEKILAAKSANVGLYQKLAKLPEKHHVSELLDKINSTKEHKV